MSNGKVAALVAGCSLLALLIGIGIGGAASTTDVVASRATTTTAGTESTVPPLVPPSETTTPAAPATTIPPPNAPPTSMPTALTPQRDAIPQGRVPNVVGQDHQLAQNTMEAAGFYNLSEEDASGQGRLLLFDRNWKVCSQSPAAGSQVSEDRTIVLRSVKDEEKCP